MRVPAEEIEEKGKKTSPADQALRESGQEGEEKKDWRLEELSSKEAVKKAMEEIGNAVTATRSTDLSEWHLDQRSTNYVGLAATGTHFSPVSFDLNESKPDSADSSGLGRARESKKESVVGNVKESLGDILTWLEGRVDALLDFHCKTWPSGRVFPLPSSPCVLSQVCEGYNSQVVSVLRVLIKSLNSMNGEGDGDILKVSDLQRKVLEGLVGDCARVCEWRFQDEPPSWAEFFQVRGVDYKGDEILTAQSMQWENVSPALPDEVGSVRLEEVVELGCKYYVENFEEFLLEPEDQVYVRPPRVMVPPDQWSTFCRNLIQKGVFDIVHEDELYRVEDKPVLNGLFGVSKGEFSGPWEVQRIIMNLVPLNGVRRSFDGDISTLPAWAGMSPLNLQPHEGLVVSSEDVRCFFYIFRVPSHWHKFLAFNRELPKDLCGSKPGRWYPCSAVLPMGFKNSVSLAQHVHRFIVNASLKNRMTQGGEAELRKDKAFTSANPMHRIYLDNFDQLEKTSLDLASVLKGTVSPLVQGLREQYAELGVPRHPKKAVSRQLRAEVQGAIVDGIEGIAHPKIEKVLKYAHLARLTLQAHTCAQKQAQVVGGGLVYIAMFRRPLLGALNHLWQFIVSFDGLPPVVQLSIPTEVKRELARFLGLLPLAYMDFRADVSHLVTASDASEFGGGVTASQGLTPMGVVASKCSIRGDVIEPTDVASVLTIGLFDGIGALRVAADALGWNVLGHVSVEKAPAAARVVESQFANSIHVQDVELVDEVMVRDWACKFTQVSVVILGSGPPCQGVSGLNASRKGALKDERSALFAHVPRIFSLVAKAFPWAQVRNLMESVASMDQGDEQVMSDAVELTPWRIDAAGVSLAHRPRLYWVDWELFEGDGVQFSRTPCGRRQVELKAILDPSCFLEKGWKKEVDGKFPTFTTSRPRSSPGYKPAGIRNCTDQEKKAWEDDMYRFPPYQYQSKHCLTNKGGKSRLPSVVEREVIMGFPKGYTANCLPKGQQGSVVHTDQRLSLVGNSWNVTVVAWLLSQLGFVLGLNPFLSPQAIVDRTSPGCSRKLQTYLHRPCMNAARSKGNGQGEQELAHKLVTLVSIKGDDIMLQHATEDLAKYHRLRSSIPAKLWKWKAVASWRWTGNPEHINVLEMRATLTALRWRIERHKQLHKKFIHLVDSMVTLRSLSRGRSSSKKLRRTLLRINALLLASKCQSVWTYVHTKQNPADAPSRRPVRKKWK